MKKLSSKKSTKSVSKTTTKRLTRKVEPALEEAVYSTPVEESIPSTTAKRSYPIWAIVAGLLGLGIIALVALNKGWLLAAVVNGKPVFRWDLNTILTKRYGQQTLEGLITEKLIADEAQKQNVNVTSDEVDKRGQEIIQSFGPTVTIDDFLKFQGLTKEDFNKQIGLQIMVQKLLTKDLTITDSDISNYIATNRAILVSTEEGKLKEEAKNAIIESTVNNKLEGFLQKIKESSTVQRFL